MAQQDITKDASYIYRRVLFSKSVSGLTPIAAGSSMCEILPKYLGVIVEEYTSPTPSYKFSEIKILNGTSKIHGDGVASYKIELRVYFIEKYKYADFIRQLKNTLVYYDENGYIYNCAVTGEPVIERVESGQKYFIKLTLQGVKKDTCDDTSTIKFTDIEEHIFENDILEITEAGLVSTISGSGYVYTYVPNSPIKRSEIAAFLNRLRKYIKRNIQ
jgi:hypothetical protein